MKIQGRRFLTVGMIISKTSAMGKKYLRGGQSQARHPKSLK
jgi:hypothetical protein